MIDLESVIKIYDNPKHDRSIVALRGCDLHIKEGRFVSIIGPSGSGKSTLMRMISGLERPTSGKVTVLSQEIDLMSKTELNTFRLNTIGFVNQLPLYNLHSDLTVEKNLTTVGMLLGKSFEEAKKCAYEVLDKLAIKELAAKKAALLSMGEGMRVSLAIPLMQAPPIILADEPTGQLDSMNTQNLIKLLKKINQEDNTTIVVVSHDPIYFSHVSESFFIFNGRLGAVYSPKDWKGEDEIIQDEKQKLAMKSFTTQIDNYSYIYLPNQIRNYLSLQKKGKFTIDFNAQKVFLENPEEVEQLPKKTLQKEEEVIFTPRKKTSEQQPIIDCKNLTKYYYAPTETLILESFNLQIYPRELIFLFGPSGSGKTTLLNILSGMDFNFTGLVKLFNEDLCEKNTAKILNLRSRALFFSSQYINLYPSMSLMENLELFIPQFERKGFYDCDYLLEYLNLNEIKNQLVENYSQGEKKRSSILMALLASPQLILADEPTANLDELNKRRVIKLLTDYIMETNASALLVTHDLLSIVPNSRLIEIQNKRISKDYLATKEICTKITTQYLQKEF